MEFQGVSGAFRGFLMDCRSIPESFSDTPGVLGGGPSAVSEAFEKISGSFRGAP